MLLYQVPSTGLLLSTVHTQGLTFIEHLLISGRAFSVTDTISWIFHPVHNAGTTVLPLYPGGSRGESGLVKVKFAKLWVYSLCCSELYAPHSVPTACHRGADPASYGHLNISNSKLPPAGRQWLHSGFARNSSFEVLGMRGQLNPKKQAEAFVRTCHA